MAQPVVKAGQRGRPLLRGASSLLPWLLPVLIILLWQFGASLNLVSPRIFPSPLKVLAAAWNLIESGALFEHLIVSLRRAFAGLAIGGGIGFVLGILNGLFPISYKLFDSTIQMVRNIPHLALLPLVIIWIGIGEEGKIFLVSLGVLFPVYVNTYHGLRSVQPGFLEVGKVYGLSHWQTIRHIVLPGALPSIFVGLRYALGIMWLTLIVAETVNTTSGIGYLAMNAREFMKADIIIFSVILYALLGKLADLITKWLEHALLPWERSRSR